MHFWTAARQRPILIRIWFENFGVGTIRLSQTEPARDLAYSQGGTLEYELSAGSNLSDFNFRAIPGEGGLPVAIELNQEGQTLPADDGVNVLNRQGNGYGPLNLGATEFERFFVTRE